MFSKKNIVGLFYLSACSNGNGKSNSIINSDNKVNI